jgi:hypothetical protein
MWSAVDVADSNVFVPQLLNCRKASCELNLNGPAKMSLLANPNQVGLATCSIKAILSFYNYTSSLSHKPYG